MLLCQIWEAMCYMLRVANMSQKPCEMCICSLQSSHGEDTKYYDIGDRRRSPPRYERSILERLHKVCLPLL